MDENKSGEEFIPSFDDLSIEELDKTIEDNVVDQERAERLICFALLEMKERRGYEKFGHLSIVDYADARFHFCPRKTFYLLEVARKLKELPQIAQALAQGKLGWSKAYRIVKVAKPEDEVMWLESALSMSARELDRRLKKEIDGVTTRLHLWLSEDQSSVWEYALEVCRRVSGANLSSAQCLEYMAGEFISTWAYEAAHDDAPCPNAASETGNSEHESDSPDEEEWEAPEMDEAEILESLGHVCPENGDLPPTGKIPMDKVSRAVMERDGYECRYPGCSARAMLHTHHIEHRSRFGSKGQAACHSLSNMCTLCVFHHRQLHAGIIGVKGKAPFDLDWSVPKPMETAMMRTDRRRMEEARKNRKKKKASRPEDEAGLQTFAVESDFLVEEETYDFNELIAFLRAREDELKQKGALRMDANVHWDALTLEDISPPELDSLLQTFAVDWPLDEEAFVVVH